MSESVTLSDPEIIFFAKFMLRYEAMIKDGNIRGFKVTDKGLNAPDFVTFLSSKTTMSDFQ